MEDGETMRQCGCIHVAQYIAGALSQACAKQERITRMRNILKRGPRTRATLPTG